MRTAQVTDADPGSDLSAPELDDSDWLTVDLPGDLHEALTRAGRLPDLDFGLANDAALWVEEREWWYRVRVPGPGRLTCHGLDTYATLYLDGKVLGKSRNMFRPFEVDLDSGGLLAICFSRPLDFAPDTTQMRKQQYSYGWDFAPRRPTIGVWRPITLSTSRALDVRVRTVSLDPVTVEVRVPGPFTATLAGVTASSSDQVALVVDAELWSPERPVLHDLTIEATGTTEVHRVGLRTLTVDREDAFRFVLNGEPCWVRGANWVPPKVAVGSLTREHYRERLQAAKDAHMNMVRVWGGGVYEHDDFYDLCDELGLLVWQDFMFACKDYRDTDPAWVAEVEAEARYQVRRLRNRPSTALWCGNNEVELLAEALGWDEAVPARSVFYGVLPRVVADEDGGTAYLPTSPLAGADRHNWQVWHGLTEPVDRHALGAQPDGPALVPGSDDAEAFVAAAHPRNYLADDTFFASEYGLCGLATYETLRDWTEPGELYLAAPSVAARTTSSRLGPRNKMDLLLGSIVGLSDDLRRYVALSHLLQSEGVKTGTEHYRRQWPRCGGNLVWQLHDVWPSTSWALIDIGGRRKPAYWAVQRAFAPTLLSFTPDGTLWVSTDVDVDGSVVVRERGFDGDLRWESTVAVSAVAGSSQPVGSFAVAGRLSSYLSVEGLGVRNRQLLADPVALDRPRAEVKVEGDLVTASAYAFQVQTSAGDCFDLEAGESRRVSDPAGLYWL